MLFDRDTCYAALAARDARFDGQFYVGVGSTGIYCRPVCPARTPRRDRCTFFPSAAAAESRGFRPCLRCRPERAPGTSRVDAPARLAHAAAACIDAGGLTDASLAQLARSLGVTGRHLRRVFEAEFGVAPVVYAQTCRLLMARRLLTETALPVTGVAMASGFGSIRRFNDVFLRHYRSRPSDLRRGLQVPAASAADFDLAYRPPYAWGAMIGFLGPRAIEGVEATDGATYRRAVSLVHRGRRVNGWVQVSAPADRPILRVRVSGDLLPAAPAVLGRVKRLFDLACRPADVASHLGPLAAGEPGLRVPGAFDGFELAVRAVLGQQISVRAARTLAGRVAGALGRPVSTPFSAIDRVFPDAARVADAGPDALCRVGVTRARAGAIVALARACAARRIVLEPGVDVERTVAALRALPGVGDWTAQYIAMRALAWPDAFPAGDFGIKKALGESSPARVRARAEAWRPWRAYAALHLWRSLQEKTP